MIASDGNIRYIIKEFPILGEQSVLASRFALAVKQIEGDDAYVKTHDALITMRVEISEQSLSELSSGLGFDTRTMLGAMDGEPVQAAINENHALARRLGIDGTSSFVFDDRMGCVCSAGTDESTGG